MYRHDADAWRMQAGRGADDMAARIAAETQRRLAAGTEPDALRGRLAAQRAYEAGADGERQVAEALACLPPGWRVLHDVHWPGRPRANLDHVAIGPTGVFVIDAKNYSHAFRVTAEGVPYCGRFRVVNEVEACSRQAASVIALLEPRHRLLVRGLMCLVAQDQPPIALAATTVLGLPQLLAHLQNGALLLTRNEVERIGDHLYRQLAGARTVPQLNTSALAKVAGPAWQTEPAARVRVSPRRRRTNHQLSGPIQIHPSRQESQQARRLLNVSLGIVVGAAAMTLLAQALNFVSVVMGSSH